MEFRHYFEKIVTVIEPFRISGNSPRKGNFTEYVYGEKYCLPLHCFLFCIAAFLWCVCSNKRLSGTSLTQKEYIDFAVFIKCNNPKKC